MITDKDEDFVKKLKNFVLWTVFNKTRGEKVTFAKYNLTENQSYIFSRVCAELALRHIGCPTRKDDNIRQRINDMIEQEEQLINGKVK